MGRNATMFRFVIQIVKMKKVKYFSQTQKIVPKIARGLSLTDKRSPFFFSRFPSTDKSEATFLALDALHLSKYIARLPFRNAHTPGLIESDDSVCSRMLFMTFL